MKNIILILPICLMLLSCSSSKKISTTNVTKQETAVLESAPTKENKTKPGETIITFKKDMFPKCGDTLSIDGHVLSIGNNETSCSYGNTNEILWLYPATLTVKLNTKRQISSIKIDYNDGCGVACTVSKLLTETGEEIQKQQNELINVEAFFEFKENLKNAKILAVSSFEGRVLKITIKYAD